jgi:hypothetical protein
MIYQVLIVDLHLEDCRFKRGGMALRTKNEMQKYLKNSRCLL